MAKKKATMTLKDFHGGSIPSDLPLPSAPGVTLRPADRGGINSPLSWGNAVGRTDNRLRPGSAGSARTFDDKTPFLSHTAHIGRNFDEDERKPLDVVSAPRRTFSDDSIRASPSPAVEPKKTASASVSKYSSGLTSRSYAGRLNEAHSSGPVSQSGPVSGSYGGRVSWDNVGANARQTVSAPYPNAWGLRKEPEVVIDPMPATWSAPDAASKLANASALDKISSGRWRSNQQLHPQNDVEVIQHSGMERDYRRNSSYNWMDVVDGKESQDVSLAMLAERNLGVDDVIHGSAKARPPAEMRSTMFVEAQMTNPSVIANGFQPPRPSGFSGSELKSPVPETSSERPKLKLLPRSKPLETLDQGVDHKREYQPPSGLVHIEEGNELHGSVNSVQPGFGGSVVENRASGRPKLTLTPRTQPLEHSERNAEIKSDMVFGGARPREAILKERGIDEVATDNYERQIPSSGKQDASKTDAVPMHAPAWFNGKAQHIPGGQRTVKNTDKKDHRTDIGRTTDAQRRNRQNDTWRNNREIERHQGQQHQQAKERPPSPETWRKPVEPQKPVLEETTGPRYGKAASAVELVKTFSRSGSDLSAADRSSRPSGLPVQGQVPIPFSRLTGPSPRPHFNGY